MKRIIIFLMIILLTCGTALAEDNNVYESQYFSITFPNGWEKISSPTDYVVVSALAPDKHGPIGITMITTPIEPNISDTIKNFKIIRPELQLENMQQIKLAGQDALSLKFKGKNEYLYVVTFHNGNFQYSILMFGTLSTSQDDNRIFEDTVATFKYSSRK